MGNDGCSHIIDGDGRIDFPIPENIEIVVVGDWKRTRCRCRIRRTQLERLADWIVPHRHVAFRLGHFPFRRLFRDPIQFGAVLLSRPVAFQDEPVVKDERPAERTTASVLLEHPVFDQGLSIHPRKRLAFSM